MNGEVDEAGRALLKLQVRHKDQGVRELLVWIDTAFDGELVISRQMIRELGLARTVSGGRSNVGGWHQGRSGNV